MRYLNWINEQNKYDAGRNIFAKKSASFHGQPGRECLRAFRNLRQIIRQVLTGIDLNAGVTTFNEVYTVSKAMCNAAREVILMADHQGFGRKSPSVVLQS